MSYELYSGLYIRASLGYNNLYTNEVLKSPNSIFPPEYTKYITNSTNFLSNRISSWITEPQVEYKREISKGNLNVLMGSTFTRQNMDQQNILAYGFTNELVMENLGSATSVKGTNINSVYKYSALYGRITYNWRNKYILNLSARRDGSSRFGPESQFHNFGAIGAAWIFSEEPFIKSSLPFLSFGKLRGSYGTTGNDQIGDYTFMDLYSSITVANPYQNTIGLRPTQLTNPYLQWEETKKLQAGIELGFFKDRLVVTANYNRNRSGNQLLGYNIPTITGSGLITRNLPAVVQNTGWEFSLSSTNIKTAKFSWTTNFNLTIPRRILASFHGDSSFYLAKRVGIALSTSAFFDYAGVNENTGQFQYRDAKGNLTVSPSDPVDRTILYNTDRNFYGGIQNSFSYCGLSLDIFFQFLKQHGFDAFTYMNNLQPGVFNAGLGNQMVTVMNRWQKPGDKVNIPAFTTNYNNSVYNYNNSSGAFIDASYIKLKNVALSWQFPATWKKSLHLQNGKVFINAQNVFTICGSRFKGFDPESLSLSVPPLRVIVIGAQLTL